MSEGSYRLLLLLWDVIFLSRFLREGEYMISNLPLKLGAPLVFGLVLLTGCAGQSSDSVTPAAGATPAGSTPVSVSASPTASTPPVANGTTSPATTTSSAATAPKASSATGPTARCATSQLKGTVDQHLSGQQTIEPILILTNTSTRPCTLQGWPGVSFVGQGSGKQLGAAGYQEKNDAHPTVTLQPGHAANAQLIIKFPSSIPASECNPTDADGFRVYPPGETHSLFIAYKTQACSSAQHKIMTVFALHPGA